MDDLKSNSPSDLSKKEKEQHILVDGYWWQCVAILRHYCFELTSRVDVPSARMIAIAGFVARRRG